MGDTNIENVTDTLNIQEDSTIASHLQKFMMTREYPKTFCPSEVARALTKSELEEMSFSDWREAMEPVRSLAQIWRDRNQIEVLQKGIVVDNDTKIKELHGPIRLRRVLTMQVI